MSAAEEVPAPSDPLLGLPVEVLRDMASTDWHAGHRDEPHEGPRPIGVPCRCGDPDVVGAFAVRLLTGQAQWSSTADGEALAVAAYVGGPVRAPRAGHGPGLSEDTIALLAVHGSVEQVPCDCGGPAPHTRSQVHVESATVGGHDDLRAQECLALVADALREIATRGQG